jgi:aminoacyl tRNA synthase complex-interacting multifunctional protein 1
MFHQQIDLGEETGPRTVVSGLVNYIPIEEMRDKYLVCIVSCHYDVITRWLTFHIVQLETREHAWSEELCDGPSCRFIFFDNCASLSDIGQATSKDGKDGGVELIQPPPGCKPGERVYFEGPDYESEKVFLDLRTVL